MNKKVLVVVGLAIILAVSGGVIALTTQNSPQPGNTNQTDASQVSSDPTNSSDIDVDETDHPTDVSVEDLTDATKSDTVPTDTDATVDPSVPFEEQIVSASMSVQYVVDHSTGAEASPRVVFGPDYNYCYVAFNTDKSFEMCVDPASGMIRKGTYQIYGDVVSVEYDDGVGSEYDILTDEYGNITHVIVNYGDYDIYFG